MITKKIFRQLIIGKILDDIPIKELLDKKHESEIKQANKIATEIIEFAEEYKLFRSDLK